jgi:RNA polymerase sigma-70 factor (ECF subfamily)
LLKPENPELLSLLEQEIPHLRRFARYVSRDPAMADDLVQECLVRAIANGHSWQPGTNLRAWLFVILRNVFLNERRKRSREAVSLVDADHPTLSVAGDQEARLALIEVNDALLNLSEDHREILLLVGVEGMTYEDVSQVLDIPLGTVRSRLARARTALRESLAEGKGKAPKSSEEKSRA